MMDEWVETDPDTGGRKGQKIARFDLIPARPLRQLAEHYGRGARKYEPRNWEKGYAYSLSYAAMMRHMNAWWAGEDYDDEGNHHLDAAMFHCMALREFGNRGLGTDDRPAVHDAQKAVQGPISPTEEMFRSYSDVLEEMKKAKEFSETFGKKETGGAITRRLARSEQAEAEGRERTVQTRRWEIP